MHTYAGTVGTGFFGTHEEVHYSADEYCHI